MKKTRTLGNASQLNLTGIVTWRSDELKLAVTTDAGEVEASSTPAKIETVMISVFTRPK